ncbi:MAG: DUF420 domain-containing protein [Myxococcota bacterium]
MDPKLIFWIAALINLAILCLVAILGVRHARRGEIARHLRSMKIATALVLAFLGSYVLKVLILGREDQSVWTLFDIWVLRIHEMFVLVMLIAGAFAWSQGRKLRGTRLVTHDPADPEPDTKVARLHRIAGRTAVINSVLGFLMAIGVIAGMFARL